MSILNNWRPDKDWFSATPMPTVDFTCYHCARTTRVVAQNLIDLRAQYWEERYKKLLGSLNDAIARSHEKHGDDPMSRDFMEELMRIRDRLEGWRGNVH